MQLGLDPRGFTEGQQQAVESLRQVERAAERTGAHVDEVGVGVLEFIRLIENPARGIVRHLERIAEPARGAQRSLAGVAAQARRTGTAGEAGTLAMASGVRALAIAGLVATAVFAGLGKVIESALGSARQTFAVGIGAAAAGLPVNEFSAISQALFTHGNVPQEQTQDWLAGIRQFQENFLLGNVDEAKLTALAKLGISNPAQESPEDMLKQLAVKFAQEPQVQAISQGASIGLSAAQSVALQNAGANLPGEIAEARRTGVTQGDVRAATDLLNAENQLSITYGKLYRMIFTELDPALIKLLSGLTEFADDLITITTDLGPFFSALGKINTLFDDMTIGWGEALGHWVASGNKKPYDDWLHKLMGDMGLGPAATPSASGTAGGPQTAADLAKDLPRLSPAQVGVLSEIRQRESGGNLRAQNPRSTASGWFGMIDSTWKEATAAIGEGSQYQHAKDAPANIQESAAAYLYLKYGPNSSHTWAASGVAKGRPYPEVPGTPAAVGPTPGVQGMLQGAQLGALAMNGGPNTTGNDNSRTTTASFGPIIVNTQAKDGPGVVASIRDAVNRNLLVAQANVGLA